MPAIGQGSGQTAASEARRRPARAAAPPRPTTSAFARGLPPRPLQAQQRQQQAKTLRAESRLPTPIVAAPPVIHNPTPKQTHAAAAAISTSLTRIVGPSGTPQERQARRDEIVNRVRTDPRLTKVRASWSHWAGEQAKLISPAARARTAADRVKAGEPPHRARIGVGPVNFGTVNLTAAGRAVTAAAEKAAPGLASASPSAQFGGNALKDIAHLPLMVPQTAYEVGAAALELAHGDTTRAKAIAKGFTEGIYGHVARGDFNGAAAYFVKHPVYSILELRGGKGFGGRGAGAVMRSGVLGDAAKGVASTSRADIKLVDEAGANVADRSHYSPDVLTKLGQVIAEKGGVRATLKDHRLRRRADFESDTAAAASRAGRQEEGKSAREAAPPKGVRDIVGLITQRVVRPEHLEADLRKEADRLDAVHAKHFAAVDRGDEGEFSTVSQRDQNRATSAAIRGVLADPKQMAQLGKAVESARTNVARINELEGRAVDAGAGVPERLDRAKLFPGAQAHLGAEYNDAPFRAARAAEVSAGRTLRAKATELRQRVRTASENADVARERVKTVAARHRSERGVEAHHGPVAAFYVGEDRFTLRKDAVAAAKERGVPEAGIRRVALTAGEAKRVGELSQARRAHAAAVAGRTAAVADLKALARTGEDAVPERRAFEEARSARKAAAIGGTKSLNVGGRRLSNDEISAELGGDVAHLPHHTKVRGAKAYYQTAFNGRKDLAGVKKRTGEAFRKGAVDVSYDAVTEHRIRVRGVVQRIAEHDRMIHDLGIKGRPTAENPTGMFSWDQAENIAENAAARGVHLEPYRAVPGSYDRDRITAIAATQGAAESPALGELIGHEFEERLKAPADGDRTAKNVVLVPTQVVNQLREQTKVSSAAGRAGNVAVNAFRKTVLPFSTKWLTGNVVEAGLRLALVGAGPNAVRIGRGVLTELDKIDHEQALRVRAALTGGLLFGNKGLTVRRFAEHFEGTALEKPAAIVGAAARLPVVHQLGQVMHAYTEKVFQLNHAMESTAQYAALGKWAKRDMQEMTGSWLKATRAQEAALHDIANGLMDSKNVHDAARYIDETLGQYSRFSPQLRRFIQSAAPFLPWYLNAVRFVFWTLPAKHPIKSGLMALAANNLQADYDASHKDLPPGDLRGDVVINGKPYPSSRYTPFGAFGGILGGGNDQLTALIDPVFPQFKGAALAAFGLNFAGHAAKIDPKSKQGAESVPVAVRASMAFNSLLEAFVPAVGIARRVEEGGSTPYDNSNVLHPKVKPGTRSQGGAVNRILNPVRATPLSAHGGDVVSSPATPSSGQASTDPWDRVDQAQQQLDNSSSDDALWGRVR